MNGVSRPCGFGYVLFGVLVCGRPYHTWDTDMASVWGPFSFQALKTSWVKKSAR